MKILFLIPTLLGGGAEKVLSDIIQMMDSKKYQITVKTLFNEGIYFESLRGFCVIEPIFKTNTKFTYWLYHSFINHSKWIPKKILWSYLIGKNYDVEISFLEGVSTRIISGSKNPKSIKIAWIHTDFESNTESFKQFRSIFEMKKVYETFNQIVAVSKRAGQSSEKILGLNPIIISNPVNKNKILELKDKEIIEKTSSKSLNLIAIGRLEPIKGFDRLLRVQKQLIEEGYSIKLKIIGIGSLYDKFKAFIKLNNMENSVELLGFKSNPYPYVYNADLLISSSFAEGYPLVIIESIVLGIPVLATRTAGSIDILGTDGVIENDEFSIYISLKQLVLEPDKLNNMKEYAKNFSVNYDPKDSLMKIEQLFIDSKN